MIEHPSCLECRILAVVGKHQQSAPLCAVDHILSENMYVGYGYRTNRAGRFAVPASVRPAGGATGDAGDEKTGALIMMFDCQQSNQRTVTAAAVTSTDGMRMESTAVAAEKYLLSPEQLLVFFITGHEAVDEDDPNPAPRFVQKAPESPIFDGLAAA